MVSVLIISSSRTNTNPSVLVRCVLGAMARLDLGSTAPRLGHPRSRVFRLSLLCSSIQQHCWSVPYSILAFTSPYVSAISEAECISEQRAGISMTIRCDGTSRPKKSTDLICANCLPQARSPSLHACIRAASSAAARLRCPWESMSHKFIEHATCTYLQS